MRDLHSPIVQASAKHQARLKERGDRPVGKDHINSNLKPSTSTVSTWNLSSHSLHAPPSSASPDTASPTTEDGKLKAAQAFDDLERELGDLKLSYAIAIYPYLAEQDDEFSVNVYVAHCMALLHRADMT